MSERHDNPTGLWVEETHRKNLRMSYRLRRTLFSEAGPTQQVDIVETVGFGRMLLNDGIVMLSERDEFVYHEMISHVPLFVHPGVRRALVIGGGDGGTVREILRHPSVESCRLVEIDPVVVAACREHLPVTAGALADPRVEVTIGDGVEFVARTEERFDLIVVDSTDPIGPAQPLFGPRFYADVDRALAPGGMVVSQAESPFSEPEWQAAVTGLFADCFERVHLYNYVNLTYPGALWSFALGIKGSRCPVADFDEGRVTGSGLEFRYYTPAIHRAAFALPAFQIRQVGDRLTPIPGVCEPIAP